MPTVSVNPPKTPVTAGSMGLAVATIPNICKMPGPPAPFVPVPLPNIGKSELSPKGYSRTVKIEGHKVAIMGATFDSIGDIASKATGGGLISMNTHGPTKFIGPGSLNVKIEGKNVQLLSDPMLNNNGPAGSPPNAATLLGVLQNPAVASSFLLNPLNDDICGDGNHVEELHRPVVPESEQDPKKRIAAQKTTNVTDGDKFESEAAEYDLNKRKDLTHGNQISRNITDQERAAGLAEEDQKIWLICSICKHRREVDEAPNNKCIVEAKSTDDAVSGGKQKRNNAALMAQGFTVIYKSPHISYDKFKSWSDEGFVMISLPK